MDPPSDSGETIESKGYEELLNDLGKTRPQIASVLKRAHTNRVKKLSRMQTGMRLHGLEEFLNFLELACAEMSRLPKLSKLAFLIHRAKADYEVAIEATFSEMRDVVFDSMRDVMEIEYLLKDFTEAPDHIDEWLSQSLDDPPGKFSPANLRKRQAQILGIEPSDLPTTKDYKAHSRFLHVNPYPNPFGGKGVLDGEAASSDLFLFSSDSSFWDMYGHASSLIESIRAILLAAGDKVNPDVLSDDQLSEFRAAHVQVKDLERMSYIMLEIARGEAPPSNEDLVPTR